MAPPKFHQSQWEHLFDQKRHEFLANDCRTALKIESFDDLQTGLRQMLSAHQANSFSSLLTRLNPILDHVQSFNNAITSASQADPRACLVWAAAQALMQVACVSYESTENMLLLVETINEALPKLEAELDLFQYSTELQIQLQDLYDTYMDYCIECIQHVKRHPAVNFLLSFITSGPQASLKKTKTAIIEQSRKLLKTAQSVRTKKESETKQAMETQHEQIQSTLQSEPLSQVPADFEGEGKDVKFPITTVSYYRNYTFLGRDDLLDAIYAHLDDKTQMEANDPSILGKRHDPKCCILHGLGGIGKTQIALEYTYRHRDKYDAIFWVQSDIQQALAAAFSDIAEELRMVEDLGGHDGQNQGRAIKRAEKWLKATRRSWLIVFDNCEDMEDLNPYLPREIAGRGSVIVTTQKPDFFPLTDPNDTIKLPVKDMDRDQGGNLVFKYLQREPHNEEELEFARKISDLVGGLPLALATIGGYMNMVGTSVSIYYENLKTSSKAWEASAIGPAKQYDRKLETVFDLALNELQPKARKLINTLAFLNPDKIPEELFIQNLNEPPLSFLNSEADLVDMIGELRRRQLVRRDATGSRPYLSIHRTVQWTVILNISKDFDERWKVFEQTFQLVRHCLPAVSSVDQPEPELWAQFERFVPQILNLRTHCLWPEPPVELPTTFAQVLSDMATYMWHAGLLEDGTEALETAEHILDDNDIGKKNPLRGNVHEHLGIFASFNGVSERKSALERRNKATEARQAAHKAIPFRDVTRADEIRLYNVESDMAFGHLQWEDFDAAEQQMEMCLKQYEKWGSEDDIPFEYLKYNHIMSYVRMAQGRPVEAVQCAKKGAALGEVCAGLMHPMTQLVRFTLCNHLFLAGEMDACEEEIRGVLSARAKICGEFNRFTLETYSFCASVLAKQGNHEEAERMYLKCLDRRKRSVWNQEGVARAQYLYAQTVEGLANLLEDKVHNAHASLAEEDLKAMREEIANKREKAKGLSEEAKATKKSFLELYPKWLPDSEDDLVVLDQMCCMWAGRYTGKLKAGADQAAGRPSITVPLLEGPSTVQRNGHVHDDTAAVEHSGNQHPTAS